MTKQTLILTRIETRQPPAKPVRAAYHHQPEPTPLLVILILLLCWYVGRPLVKCLKRYIAPLQETISLARIGLQFSTAFVAASFAAERG